MRRTMPRVVLLSKALRKDVTILSALAWASSAMTPWISISAVWLLSARVDSSHCAPLYIQNTKKMNRKISSLKKIFQRRARRCSVRAAKAKREMVSRSQCSPFFSARGSTGLGGGASGPSHEERSCGGRSDSLMHTSLLVHVEFVSYPSFGGHSQASNQRVSSAMLSAQANGLSASNRSRSCTPNDTPTAAAPALCAITLSYSESPTLRTSCA